MIDKVSNFIESLFHKGGFWSVLAFLLAIPWSFVVLISGIISHIIKS